MSGDNNEILAEMFCPNPDYAAEVNVMHLGLSQEAKKCQLNGLQQALVADTLGLLTAISSKKSRFGQKRIRDNLVQLLESSDTARGTNFTEDMRKTCLDILSAGGLTGITIEGYEFEQENERWQQNIEGKRR